MICYNLMIIVFLRPSIKKYFSFDNLGKKISDTFLQRSDELTNNLINARKITFNLHRLVTHVYMNDDLDLKELLDDYFKLKSTLFYREIDIRDLYGDNLHLRVSEKDIGSQCYWDRILYCIDYKGYIGKLFVFLKAYNKDIELLREKFIEKSETTMGSTDTVYEGEELALVLDKFLVWRNLYNSISLKEGEHLQFKQLKQWFVNFMMQNDA
jgi:hypothetical protein